jgi:hypothetical protein
MPASHRGGPGRSSGICGRQSGTGTDFSSSSSAFPVNIVPPCAPYFPRLQKNSSFAHLIYFIHPFTHPHPGTDKRPVYAAAV